MTNINSVNILYARNEILVKLASFSFSESLFGNNIVKEFSAVTVLHDHVKFSICFDDLIVNGALPHKALQY
jgi:hypothetical protein